MTRAPDTPDFLLPFQFDELGVRGRLVRLGTVADTVVHTHDYPPAVGEILAQSLALSAILAGALKFDGVFTLQTKGDGPISTIVADTTSKGEMRGYASFDAERLGELAAGAAGAALGPVPRFLGTGYLAFTVDQGPRTERYQGIVELIGPTLADCAHQYLRQSEQIEAGVRLAAAKRAEASDSAPWRAGALMLQRLPPSRREDGSGDGTGGMDDGDEGWRRAIALMSSVTDGELLDSQIAPYDLLRRLFHEERVTVFNSRSLVHRCRCSTLRVQRALASIPPSEIESLKVEGVVRVVCQFCNATYEFDDAALRRFRAAG